MSLKYEPSSEPLHNSAKKSFLNRGLARQAAVYLALAPKSVTLYEVQPPAPKPVTLPGYLAHNKPPPLPRIPLGPYRRPILGWGVF